jgi:hypothetical protein
MARNLRYLINRVRENVFQFGANSPLIDGYAGDPALVSGKTGVNITEQINRAQLEVVRETSYSMDEATIALVNGDKTYPLLKNWYDIRAVWHNGYRIIRSNIGQMDREFPDWRRTADGPFYRYIFYGTNKIGLDVAPSATEIALDDVLTLLVTLTPDDLSDETADFLQYIPDVFEYLIINKASLNIAAMDSGNPNNPARVLRLEKEYNEGVPALKTLVDNRMGITFDDNMENPANTPVSVSSNSGTVRG